ncbi:MAG: TonB-dependent receptor plug domain-containing protein [Nitrincola lacisaponensis]|uniref:TonB-dependent receptor plug domain-containing protein n=1 Tax=Nitrincola lacisaponensis TaxID=267850 RepID=UPI00391B77CC
MQKRYIHSTLLTCLTGFIGMASISVAEAQLDESAFLIDIPIVTSATRLSQQQSDAPVAMTVIDRATIAASGAQTVPDLFRLVPGFQVAHVNTNKYAVTYHGHSDDFPRRLEVMIDGRSVYMPLISSPDWTSLGLHLDDIERIEVVRGSNTATHGSNAFMGAINIITRHPSTEARASGSITLGSLNTQNSNLRFSGHNSIGHYRLSGGYEENTGSQRFGDGARRNYLNFSGSFAPTIRDQIEIWAGVDRGHTTGGSLKMNENQTLNNIVTMRRDYRSDFQHLSWNRILDTNLSLEVKGYRNALDLAEQQPSIDDILRAELNNDVYLFWKNNPGIFNNCVILPVNLIATCNQYNRYLNAFNSTPALRLLNENGSTTQEDIQVSLTHQESWISTSSGIGYRRDSGSGRTLFDQGDISSSRYRAFVNAAVTPSPAYTLNIGTMYEKEDSGPSAISARAGLNIHLTPDLSLRLGLSQSERLPSLHERYGESTIYYNGDGNEIFNAFRRPNPDLKSERVVSHEFGALYRFSIIPGTLDLRLFKEDVSRGIETYRATFPETQENGSSTTHVSKNLSSWTSQGAEVQLKLQPRNDLWMLLNYAYINSTKPPYFNGNQWTSRTDALAPRHSASALVSWHPRPDLQLSASHYFVDRFHWFEGDTRDAYNRTDLRIAKLWTPNMQTQAELSLTLQNALGPTYQEFYDYHDFERRVFMQFRLKYH